MDTFRMAVKAVSSENCIISGNPVARHETSRYGIQVMNLERTSILQIEPFDFNYKIVDLY